LTLITKVIVYTLATPYTRYFKYYAVSWRKAPYCLLPVFGFSP